jgi:stage IV sporulation protein FB
MLSGGFTIGKVLGFPIHIGFSALLIALWIGWSFGGGQLANAAVFTAVMFGSILVHELGHAVVGRRLGLRPTGIVLHGFGGLCTYSRAPDARQGVISAAAGPGAGLLLGLVALAVQLVGGDALPAQVQWTLGWLVRINLFWSLFNLVPLYPLDGGHVLWHGLRMVLPGGKAWRITRWVGFVTGGLVVLVGLATGQWFLMIVAAMSIANLIDR